MDVDRHLLHRYLLNMAYLSCVAISIRLRDDADKSSSAELSEAINSMYQWYQRSVVCFAYLADVKSSSNYYDMCQSFRGSKWFYRGWTLQACTRRCRSRVGPPKSHCRSY